MPINVLLAQNETRTNFFRAKVLEVIAEKEKVLDENGQTIIQQNLKLRGLDGEYENKEFEFQGISDLIIGSANTYRAGDKVWINVEKNDEKETFFISDYARTNKLYILMALFGIIVILVGKQKSSRALISLILSTIVIMKFIVPQIARGANPLLISILGAFFILIFVIYVTEGINKKSHAAVLSILGSLLITGILALIFTKITRLTGSANDEALFLIGLTEKAINFQGLFLAGLVIGALGVLDDIVISQIAAVEEIKNANPHLPEKQIYQRALKIGISHIGSMINTLFLVYAGASLPLLLLFTAGDFSVGFNHALNNEAVAAEIIRTLVGSIGLTLSMPIATILGIKFLQEKKQVD